MSVYEVHLESWRQGESYRSLAEHLVNYVKDLGFTHVELMPVMEHPYSPSWGYQVSGYYAPTSRFGSPDDFRYFVDTMHRNGIGVLLDWVPAHFPKDEFALAASTARPCTRTRTPTRRPARLGHAHLRLRPPAGAQLPCRQRDLLAPGVPRRRPANRCGRLDALPRLLPRGRRVAPNIYGGRDISKQSSCCRRPTRRSTAGCRGRHDRRGVDLMAGGHSRNSLGGLGFGLKWNMGWMHDSLEYISHEPIHRQYHHHQVTFSMVYAWSENFVLPVSHDEVVHGKGSLLAKMPGDRWQQLANVRAYLAYQWSHPGKQLIFMGSEFARSPSGPRATAWTGGCWTSRRTTESMRWSRISTASTAHIPRCGSWTAKRRGSHGSMPRRRG